MSNRPPFFRTGTGLFIESYNFTNREILCTCDVDSDELNQVLRNLDQDDENFYPCNSFLLFQKRKDGKKITIGKVNTPKNRMTISIVEIEVFNVIL